MTVSLHSLSDGVYTVTWKAVSATDGHQTEGTFPFGVGNVNTSALPVSQQTSTSSLPASALIAKWLLLASLAVLTGQLPFIKLIWQPAAKRSESELPATVLKPPVWNRLYRIGLGGVLVALLIGLLAQAGQATGSELALPWSPAAIDILTTTRLGIIWLIRLALAFISVWLVLDKPAPWKRWAGFAASLGLLLTISLTSHAATEAHPVLPVLDDWIHITAMTFWFGGLAYLLTGLRELRQIEGKLRTRLTSLVMIRFSAMALVCVGLIGITGLYSASLRVGTFNALLISIYGHALLFKQIFVLSLLLLAGINLVFISPRLNRDRQLGVSNVSLVNRFGKIVLAETILAGFLLAAVSLLTYLPPAKITPPSQELSGTAKVDDLKMDLRISPGQVGQNTFTLRLTSNGKPVTAVKDALLRFTPDQGNFPPSEGQLLSQGDGTFTAKGTYLSLPARWQVQAVVRRADKFDAYANFDFTIRKPGSTDQASATPHLAGALIFINGLLTGLLMVSLPVHPKNRFAIGILPTLLFLGLGLYYMTLPLKSTSGEANPIPPNNQSITEGKTVYTQHCVVCHGVSGKGDGPVGLTLNPRPADLTLHGVPGVHTDAQLYDWITNGLLGTRMPAWRKVISDTDRWNLVNYIRSLAQAPQ
jgi:copper transport protein